MTTIRDIRAPNIIRNKKWTTSYKHDSWHVARSGDVWHEVKVSQSSKTGPKREAADILRGDIARKSVTRAPHPWTIALVFHLSCN